MEKLWCALVETCGFKGNFGSWPQCRFEVHELSGMWHTARWRWMATHRCCWQCQSWMVCLWTNGYLAVIKTKGSVDSLVGRCQESAEFFFWKDNRRPMLNTQNAPSRLQRTFFDIERLDGPERHEVQTWKGFPTCYCRYGKLSLRVWKVSQVL